MRDFQEIFLSSALSETTRKVRRNLLIFSVTLLMIIKGDLVPTSVEPLGISISPDKQELIPNFLFLVVTYYLVKFFIYMQIDGKLLVYGAQKAEFPDAREKMGYRDFLKHVKKNSKVVIHRHGWSFMWWSLARNSIDIFFPLLVAAFTLWHHINA